MSGDDTTASGRLVGAIDVNGGKTKRLEIRILLPDETHRYTTLIIVRWTSDGRRFSTPLFERHAREFAHILDTAIRMSEEEGGT